MKPYTSGMKQHRLKHTLAPRLLRWFETAKRDTPWRRMRDPYRIWLIEVMLQQTRVETGTPYYEKFVRRFPTLRALAEASVDDVLGLWAGLGYYSRARNMHAAARMMVERHGGRVPQTVDELTALPGVGRYIAGAVASIAYGVRAPVVDGNVMRVLCRLEAIRANPKEASVQRRLWALAGELVPEKRPGQFNEALMELGSILCTPKAPACPKCPVRGLCEARRLGIAEKLPRLPKRKPTPHYDIAVGIIRRRGKFLIVKRPADAMLGGLWELPGGKRQAGESLEETARREIREETDLDVEVGRLAASVNHAFSHFRITLHAFECRWRGGRVRLSAGDEHRWVAADEAGEFPVPAATRKVFEQIREGAASV